MLRFAMLCLRAAEPGSARAVRFDTLPLRGLIMLCQALALPCRARVGSALPVRWMATECHACAVIYQAMPKPGDALRRLCLAMLCQARAMPCSAPLSPGCARPGCAVPERSFAQPRLANAKRYCAILGSAEAVPR